VVIAVSSEENYINIMPVGIDALSEETACIGHKEGSFQGFQ